MDAFVSASYCCPITRRLMRDPVTTRYGHSYERAALVRALTNNGGKDPVENRPLRNNRCEISTNHALRRAIRRYDPSLETEPYEDDRLTVRKEFDEDLT
jgi:hypothetical protein